MMLMLAQQSAVQGVVPDIAWSLLAPLVIKPAEIREFLAAANVVKGMRHMRIGQIGSASTSSGRALSTKANCSSDSEWRLCRST